MTSTKPALITDAFLSEAKQEHLLVQLVGFWAADEWNLKQCPLVKNGMGLRTPGRFGFLAPLRHWVVTLYRGDKDVSNGTIPLPEGPHEIGACIP